MYGSHIYFRTPYVFSSHSLTKRSKRTSGANALPLMAMMAMQHTALHCTIPQHTASQCNTLQHTATHCNTLQHTATHCSVCNTLQHIATRFAEKSQTRRWCQGICQWWRCNTLYNTATHCSTPQHAATHCNTLQHASQNKAKRVSGTRAFDTDGDATRHNTLQHTASHFNSLQHTATRLAEQSQTRRWRQGICH